MEVVDRFTTETNRMNLLVLQKRKKIEKKQVNVRNKEIIKKDFL